MQSKSASHTHPPSTQMNWMITEDLRNLDKCMEIRRSIALYLIGAEPPFSPGPGSRLAAVDKWWVSKIGELSTNSGTRESGHRGVNWGDHNLSPTQRTKTQPPKGPLPTGQPPLHLSGSWLLKLSQMHQWEMRRVLIATRLPGSLGTARP